MVQTPDKFRHVQFVGAKPAANAVLERWSRPARQAPSPSIFAAPFGEGRHEPAISPADRLLLEEVFRRLQVNEVAYRPEALGRRVPACLRALQVRSPGEAVRRLKVDSEALDLAANALLIGVTAFFRDEAVFSHLAGAVPQLVRASPEPRVVSVGCSDGAEAYSLAILLLEAGVENFSIRGIDCRGRAIERARAGVYPATWLAHMPRELRDRYFTTDSWAGGGGGGGAGGAGYRVKAALRERVEFQLGDAFVHVFSPPYDLVACRNFAIYLGHPAAAALAAAARDTAARGIFADGKSGAADVGIFACGSVPFSKGLAMIQVPPRSRFYSFLLQKPTTPVAWTISVAAMLLVAVLNLGPLGGRVASVAYSLPLILCLWTRNRTILYLMAVTGSGLGYYKTVHTGTQGDYESRLFTWWFQLVNIWVPAIAVHVASYSFDRLDVKRKLLIEANEELAETNREVASREHEVVQQNEELQSQSEELERQTEELRQQAEEFEQQTVELHAANDELTRRERGLQTLLESARWLRSDLAERDVMSAVCQAAVQVMEEGVSAAAVVFPQNGFLTLRGHFGFGVHGTMRADVPFPGTFAAMVMARGQTAYIADIQSRPDLNLAQPAAGRLFRSVLSTPLTVEGKVIGAVEVYAQQPREWTDGEFKVIEWLAAQCALALQAIEYQQEVVVKRREAEEASVQKTRFLAAVSHDVRTPANAISLMADLIEQSAATPGAHVDLPHLAKDLKSNARSLVELVSDVLDLTRLDSGKPDLHVSEFALQALLKTSLRQFERIALEKKVALQLEPGDADVMVRTDKMKLARILANLLGNAVKFTEAGAVALRAQTLADGGVSISVADTGVGIPADAKGRIFDEFYQLQNPERDRNKGSGLGLAICKRLVTALGFSLDLESTVGVGSTFTITIPRHFVLHNRPAPEETVAAPKNDGNTLRDMRVLLVEDHDVTRRAAARLLTTRGATVLEARTGREALHLLLHDQPHVLLLDLMLPDADGTDILKHLKLNRPASLRCVLAVSGDVRDARRIEVKELGADDLIAKPLDIQHLLNAIVVRLAHCNDGDGKNGDRKNGDGQVDGVAVGGSP